MPFHSTTIHISTSASSIACSSSTTKTPFKLAVLYNNNIADAHPSFLFEEAILYANVLMTLVGACRSCDCHPSATLEQGFGQLVSSCCPARERLQLWGKQATGLDAWASRVKCPARFVSHLHDILWVVCSFCLFCCLFIIVTTQFVALYKPCKPKPKFR